MKRRAALTRSPRRRGRLFPFAALGFLILMAGAATVSAQPAGPFRRVGFLWIGTPDGGVSPSLAPFREGMRERGYFEGKNLVIDIRDGRGDAARLGTEAAALSASDVEVIVTQGSGPTAVAKQATSRVPIVFGAAGDPVGRGLVTSLARPGGNVTGRAIDLAYRKTYELLREAAPTLRRAGLLYHAPGFPPGYLPVFVAERQAAAAALGLELVLLPVSSLDEVEPALAGFAMTGGTALFVDGDPVLVTGRGVVNSLTLRFRMISVCTDPRSAEAGCLLTYGEDVSDSFRQAAGMVDRILKGTKPGINLLSSLELIQGSTKVFETPIVQAKQINVEGRDAVAFEMDVPLDKLKPGQYLCQLNVIDDVGGSFAFPRFAVLVRQPAVAVPAGAPVVSPPSVATPGSGGAQ